MRKKFSKEFKIQAVKLIVKDDVSVKQISKELEVSQNTLYRWVQDYGKALAEAHGVGFTPEEFEKEKQGPV